MSCTRAVEDMRGLTAWQRLFKKYNPRTMARAIRLVAAVTHPPKVKELKQGKVLKKDFGEEFSDTVQVGIVTAMMPESIQEFVYSSLGIAVEYDTILAQIREVQTKFSEDDQEIDVVNMSIQCHGCGGWEQYKSKCPTAWAVMQQPHQVGSNGSKGPGKGGKNSAKGIGGFGKGGKGSKGKGVFPSKCLKNVATWDIASRTVPRLAPLTTTSRFRMHRRITWSLCGTSVTWTWMAVGR